VGKGITAHLFYFARGKDGAADDFGLILDAPVAAVSRAFPRYTGVKALNGYRRQLQSIADPDGSGNGQEKALLVCRADKP
jgi:hypothetical protein